MLFIWHGTEFYISTWNLSFIFKITNAVNQSSYFVWTVEDVAAEVPLRYTCLIYSYLLDNENEIHLKHLTRSNRFLVYYLSDMLEWFFLSQILY